MALLPLNRTLDADTAKAIIERQFVEVIIAPDVSPEAQTIVAQKANVRLLNSGVFPQQQSQGLDYKRVTGGLLVQDRDTALVHRR